VSSKRQQEADAETAKDTLAEVEVDESFAQRNETEQRIRRVSDIENEEASDDSDSHDESEEIHDLADIDLSGEDTEDAPDDDKGPSQTQKPPKVCVVCVIPRMLTQCYTQSAKTGKPKLRDQVSAKRNETKGKGQANTVDR